MLVYKFRSQLQFAYALDIILQRRLRCSDWMKLNDPMEGRFSHSAHGDILQKIAKTVDYKKKTKICALCSRYDCHLMWAHYAEGFQGMAIEIDLPEIEMPGITIKTVDYDKTRCIIANDEFGDPEALANKVLTVKSKHWKHEEEVRILNKKTDNQYFLLPREARISRVIAGHRMDRSLLEALRLVCANEQVELRVTQVDLRGFRDCSIQTFLQPQPSLGNNPRPLANL